MLVSMDGGASFVEPLTGVTFGRVEHCVTDLVSHHICVTDAMELIIIGIGVSHQIRSVGHDALCVQEESHNIHLYNKTSSEVI